MKYFIIENGQQAGPFDIFELAQKGLNSDTLVWAEGMADWTPAWQVEELKAYLYGKQQGAATPPPPPAAAVMQQTWQADGNPLEQKQGGKPKKGSSHTFLWVALAIILFAAILLGVTCPDRKQHREAIETNITSVLTKTMDDNIPLPKQLRQLGGALGGTLVSTLVGPLIDQVAQYHNYVFFSTTTIEFGGTSHTASVGVLGKVFTVGEDDIASAIEGGFGKKIDTPSSNDWLSAPSGDANSDDDANSDENSDSDDSDATANEEEELVNDVKDVVKKHVKKQVDPNDEKGLGAVIDKIIDMI